jgi:hypothetical protein
MKLWHDDVRRPPDEGWSWARTNKEAVYHLLAWDAVGLECWEASLDHDLGDEHVDPEEQLSYMRRGQSPDGDGVDLVKAMIALRLVPPKVTIHSWNIDGAAYMAGLLESLSGAEVIVKPWEVPGDACPIDGTKVAADGKCPACGYPRY